MSICMCGGAFGNSYTPEKNVFQVVSLILQFVTTREKVYNHGYVSVLWEPLHSGSARFFTTVTKGNSQANKQSDCAPAASQQPLALYISARGRRLTGVGRTGQVRGGMDRYWVEDGADQSQEGNRISGSGVTITYSPSLLQSLGPLELAPAKSMVQVWVDLVGL